MIKFFLCLLFCILTVFSYSQKTNKQGINSNPVDIINKVITYGIENRNTFDGSCKVGYVQGESYFSFRKFSNKFPNIFVSYSALGRSATEGGILRNIKFVNSGNFKTKIIVADWENFDKNHAGSGTFQLSVLDENYPNKLYVGISGYNWSYYINIELKENDFQDIINLLTYSGKPRNIIKEKQDKIDAELIARKLELRNRFIQDSLKKIKERIQDSLKRERVKKDLIAKKALDLEIAITKRIKDSIDLKYDDSLRYTLQVLDVYKDGIVIKVDGNGHGLLISKLQFIDRDNTSWENTKSIMYKKLSNEGWELPKRGSEEIDFFKKNYKNEEFRLNFKGSRIDEYIRLCMTSKNDVMAILVGNQPWELFGKSNEDYRKLYFFGIKSF
jgi:hypothetical protein